MATDIRILLGRRIRRLRKARGWKQLDLAVSMIPEQNQNYISVIELGKTDTTVTMLQRIARALEVEIEDLFHDLASEELVTKSQKPKKRR